MSNPGRVRAERSNPVLDRAFAAGAWLCAGVLAMTGIFIARIDSSSAVSSPAVGNSTNGGTNSDSAGSTSVLPGGGGQVAPAPQYQVPQARTHGS